jgi:hypothetical protein
MCVGTYVEKDSKCDLATEIKIIIGYKSDTEYLVHYEMQSDGDLQISSPFELELYLASPEIALKGGVTGHSSKKTPHQTVLLTCKLYCIQ